jgi:hypothetical protein
MYDTPQYNSQFTELIKFRNGGRLRIHEGINKMELDFRNTLLIAYKKAAQRHFVDVMPILQGNDPKRAVIFPDGKPFKNPDLRIDGMLAEIENLRKAAKMNTLKHRISDGAKQADYVIINLDEIIDINLMRRTCKGRFIDNEHLAIVEFFYKGTSAFFRRDDFNYEIKEPLHE